MKNLIKNGLVVENATRWLSNQLKIIDRDPHPHDLAVVAFSLQVIGTSLPLFGDKRLFKYLLLPGCRNSEQ